MRWHAVVLAVLALAWPGGPVRAQSGLPVEEVERIVKDYLLREPEILYQALQELQRRRDAAEAERQKTILDERREELVANPDDPVLGDPKGDVTLVEFIDYRCGYCRSMAPALRALLEQDRRVRLVIKEFPILGPDSTTAARAALAARRQGRYAELHWALLQSKDLSEAAILDLARRLGLDADRLARDMRDPAIERQLEKVRALADALGLGGTPSFVVGDTLIPGAAPVARLAELIGRERRAAR